MREHRTITIEEQSFLTPKERLGYTEEYIIVKGETSSDSQLLKYSLSNSLEDIKIAIYERTGHNINLENASWKLNHSLSTSVKHLMNRHGVTYAMTTWQDRKNKSVVVNMRVNDKWFITGFKEIKGTFYSWSQLETIRTVNEILNKIFQDETDEA
jgi:hypothetical protein